MNNFQRKGVASNAQVGRDFEKKIQSYFQKQGIDLSTGIAIEIGIDGKKKKHKFDLGNIEKQIIVECKSHTWTVTENVPSAKITTWDQTMYFFHAAPSGFRKIFFVLKHLSLKRNETLCEYYIRTNNHLIPNDVEIWEFDESKGTAERKKDSEQSH
jgi:hypothetical protein